MYTECPACQTVFRVTAVTLRTAHGQARCGVCNTTFDALFGLTDELPAGHELPVDTLGELTSSRALRFAASRSVAAGSLRRLGGAR